MTRVMVLALFMYATLYAGMAKSREECATAADPTKCMAGSDGEVLLQSKLAIDHTDVEEEGLDDEDAKRAVEGLDERGFHSLLLAMPLVLSNISNYTGLYSTQLSNHLDVQHKFGKDKASDTRLLLENVDGFLTLMQEEVLDKDDNACPRDSVLAINGCLSRAMCLIQFYVDGDEGVPSKKDMKNFALIEELYTRFQDMTWPQTVSMLGVGEAYDVTKVAGYATPDQHSCDADSAWDKEEASLIETNHMAAAYRTSAALVSATKATHAILDAHTHNSSVDATAAALHFAWKPACEKLGCDGTNYRDLWRASHAHSTNLIETGASARHMRVHIRTRQRLELRMQQFLGEHAVQFGDKVHKDAATTWRSAPKQYFSQSRGALLQSVMSTLTEKRAPISTRVYPLRLIEGRKLEQSLLESGKKQSLQFLRSEAALLVDEEDDDHDDDLEDERNINSGNLGQVDADTIGEDDKLRATGESPWGRIGKAISKSANALGSFATDDWAKFETGLDKTVDAIKAADDATGLSVIPGISGIVGEAKKLNFDKYVAAVTYTTDEVTSRLAAGTIDGLESLGDDVSAVTTKYANVAATATEAAARFLLALFECSGSFSEGYGYGYGNKIPDDPAAIAAGVWPMATAFAFGVTVDDTAGPGPLKGIADLLNGEPLGFSLTVVISIVFGACPGAADVGGARVGLGVTAGFGCGSGSVNPEGGPDCSVGLVIGATGSALIPTEGACLGPDTIGPFHCFFAYSVMVSIMCCQFWVISGEGDCR